MMQVPDGRMLKLKPHGRDAEAEAEAEESEDEYDDTIEVYNDDNRVAPQDDSDDDQCCMPVSCLELMSMPVCKLMLFVELICMLLLN